MFSNYCTARSVRFDRQADHLCVRTSGLGLVQFLFCIITNIFLLYGNKSKSVHRIEGRTGQRFCHMSLPLSVLPDSTVREKDLRDVVEQMPDTPRAQQRLVYCTSMLIALGQDPVGDGRTL